MIFARTHSNQFGPMPMLTNSLLSYTSSYPSLSSLLINCFIIIIIGWRGEGCSINRCWIIWRNFSITRKLPPTCSPINQLTTCHHHARNRNPPPTRSLFIFVCCLLITHHSSSFTDWYETGEKKREWRSWWTRWIKKRRTRKISR